MTDTETYTIDLTPTWRQNVSVFIMLLTNGNQEGRDYAKAELYRLAAADAVNSGAKTGTAALESRIEALLDSEDIFVPSDVGDALRDILDGEVSA